MSETAKSTPAFSLIEMLVVVAIIAVLAALIFPSISPMRGVASERTARQQQAELQTALGNWISAVSGDAGGLAAARSAYNAANNKLSLLSNYLQPGTYTNLVGTGTAVRSAALTTSGARLEFSAPWNVGGYPTIQWINSP